MASRAGGATAAPGRRPAHAGFTLIELMTAVVVLAIVAFAAAPSFSSMLAQQRVRGAALDLSSSLLLARSEAVKRNATVSVAATGTAWTGGWTVAAGAETVRSFGAYQGLSIVASGGNTLSVGNDGRLTGGALTFQVAPSTGASNASTVCVQISATGRVASSTGACT
ncbi:GspH/FimT family pseudopilin [Cupriavidus sp. IDO]|uniref:GspH/FimT family pseudopilin n=1 Tax=Cupriavidus sp. IDO TaxID=1539142 RepID=UPI000579459B|nr:GspH/FimT family pseudopilin [Cupriavidus sp. IDO]KWR90096.1 general secretion pathway protein GspH [Cupriavidus sp. IDO]